MCPYDKLNPHKYDPIECRGKFYYITVCKCRSGIAYGQDWNKLMDERHEKWEASQPKTPEQLLIEKWEDVATSQRRLADALEHLVEVHKKWRSASGLED